ncbi:MAG: sigma-70 family RNA polymerase sigma factor [Verrucomicrobia bacterium]|nr:sigma-70 family RNA polymerase sigma factor [Cytophagales bacterium]
MKAIQDERIAWQQFKAGNKEAFEWIFRRYKDVLYSYGCNNFQDTELVENAIQDLFVDLGKKRANLPEVLNLKAYLVVALKKRMLSLLKNKQREANYLTETAIPASESATHFSPESQWIENEENTFKNQKVEAAISHLSAREREIIHLRFYQDLEYEAISEIMALNGQTARNLLYRAMKKLKTNLSSQFLLDTG